MKGRVLVTGGAVRVGRAIVEALAEANYAVAIHCRNSVVDAEGLATALNLKHGTGTASVVRGDLSNDEQTLRLIPDLIAAHGHLVGLVNSASIFEDDAIATITADGWKKHFDINLRAPVLLAQAFAKQLPAGIDGAIVNIIDQRVLNLTPDFFSYTLSKSALLTATQTLAQALAPRVRVNAVGPGPVLQSIHQSTHAFDVEAKATLLQRSSPPQDVAAAVMYLMQARSVTGHMIPVDSGQHLARKGGDAASPKDNP